MTPDPYSRVEYRRLIAWTRRIEREGPWLLELLEAAPDRSVVDFGPGTGEHLAFFADHGARAVGIDRSESMIEAARDYEAEGRGRFVLGDARDAPALLADEPPFGLAICLGNVLPHLLDDDDPARLFGAAAGVLRPGGRLLVQILNYEKILSSGQRALPVNLRTGEDGEDIVFLRLMIPAGKDRLWFCPTTLGLDLSGEEPVSVRRSKRVELRPWTSTELLPALDAAGFDVERHGDMEGGAFEPDASSDLVLLGTRRG